MKTHTLRAEPRTLLGKQVRKLRKQGIIPGNIYGKSVKSTSVSIPMADFKKVYEETGETGLIEVTIQGAKEPHHVLVHHVQIHPVDSYFIHVDFHEVALKEKIQVAVPITFTGESPAAAQKKGVLITLLNELTVEALPMDLPEEIIVDLSTLKEVNDTIKASSVSAGSKAKIIADEDEDIARINPLEKEEAPAPAATPTEGEATPEAKPEEGKQASTAPATKPAEKKE
jgi:large subunit ribosomal protein L25